jgi:hypothetical protein
MSLLPFLKERKLCPKRNYSDVELIEVTCRARETQWNGDEEMKGEEG